MKRPLLVLVGILGVVAFVTMADTCSPAPTAAEQAQAQAAQKSQNHAAYIPKNDVEFNNYNNRMKISDDPTTILWCTSAFPIPSSPLFTIPVVGKLTSATKRPYPTSTTNTTAGTQYSPELPGPDGMYGPSTDYRYGFTPAGVYVDFYNLQTYCTTEPSIWQRQATKIVLGTDDKLFQAQQKARQLLAAGDKAGAEKVLEAAING
jgi:hypothetical protein